VRVVGKWKDLFRAVDKHSQLIDFMMSDRRDTGAAGVVTLTDIGRVAAKSIV
jgi:transposase-like protein